jgi:death-on-curing protein
MVERRRKQVKRKSRRIYLLTIKVFYNAIERLKNVFPMDDFTVLNPYVFETVIEHLKWELRYRGFVYSAASLFYDLIMDHPLVDGNKRLATVILVAYLRRNGYDLREKDSLYSLAILVAEKKINKRGVSEWLRRRLVKRR